MFTFFLLTCGTDGSIVFSCTLSLEYRHPTAAHRLPLRMIIIIAYKFRKFWVLSWNSELVLSCLSESEYFICYSTAVTGRCCLTSLQGTPICSSRSAATCIPNCIQIHSVVLKWMNRYLTNKPTQSHTCKDSFLYKILVGVVGIGLIRLEIWDMVNMVIVKTCRNQMKGFLLLFCDFCIVIRFVT